MEELPLLQLSDLEKCSGRTVALDTETTGLSWYFNEVIGISVHCPSANVTGYLVVDTPSMKEDAVKIITEWDENTLVIGHNIKFDLHFLRINPGKVPWKFMDTTVMVHLLDSRYRKGLAEAEKTFLGNDSKRRHVDKAPPKKMIWEWPLDVLSQYAANDAIVTYQLAEVLWPMLKEWGLEHLFWKDMEYLAVLYDIEEYGFLVDVAMLNEDKEFLLQRNHELEEVLFDAIGYRFNWRSNPQLSKALYEDIGHPRPVNPFVVDGKDISRNPQAGKYNKYLTSTFILTEKAHHPLGELVASIRETAKLVSTIDGLMKLIDPANVVHTNFNLTGTRTGRLASGKPNLQNVASEIRGRVINQMFSGDTTLAIRSGAFNLRKSFTARPGKILVSVDYKQMEMRMFGILSGDPFMLKSLSQGRDIHADIAEACWGIRDETHREWAKSISFGLIYGMTMGSLRFRLDLTFEMAKKITDDYWRTFPRIKPWLKQVQVDCKEAGYLRYWSGRMWREEDDMLLYKGANALIQGGCADLMSIAAIRVHRWLKEQGEDFGHIVNLVHDEIIFEVAEEDVLWAAQEVAKIMLVEDLLGIPFLNDIKIGYNYGEMEKLSKLLEEEKSNDSK